MSEQKVTITVTGHVGTGKSAFAQAIQEGLKEAGINVTLEDGNARPRSYDDLERCLESLKKADVAVHIKTQQLNRSYDEPLKGRKTGGSSL